jgi:hypothetical protein
MMRQHELIREAGDRLREAEQELDAARTRAGSRLSSSPRIAASSSRIARSC